MRHRHLHVSLALLVIVAAGCDQALPTVSPLSAGSTHRRGDATALPFRLVLTGTANPDFSQGPCNVVNTESGTGVAEHLGRVTWTSTEVANFCVDPTDPALATVTGNIVPSRRTNQSSSRWTVTPDRRASSSGHSSAG